MKPFQCALSRWQRSSGRQSLLGMLGTIAVLIMPLCDVHAEPSTSSPTDATSSLASNPLNQSPQPDEIEAEPAPFDYDPYRVLIWIASDSTLFDANDLREKLSDHLDRDFRSIWRTTIQEAPTAVRTIAMRDLGSIDFSTIAAADPVLAIKRDHGDLVRMKFANDVSRFVSKIYSTSARIDEMRSRVAATQAAGSTKPFDWLDQLVPIDGNALEIGDRWIDPSVEAVLVSRGMADELGGQRIGDSKQKVPTAKIITPPILGQVADAMDQFDKVFVVSIHSSTYPAKVEAIELDTLMRNFGPLASGSMGTGTVTSINRVAGLVGVQLRKAFRPVVRIDDAGTRSAKGLIRAAGLIVDEASPGAVGVGDVLEPMVRKNDRNGNPISIGPLDWAYLVVDEKTKHTVDMSFYAGRLGGLQGRSNNRTFRVALKVKPQRNQTKIRLHAQKNPDQPLIGYEIYDKELDSTSMTFVGRTDWNGRMNVEPIDRPLRLLYVKNGGAVLARLPVVPGHHEWAVADLAGDDMRLQAESYIRGVQNSIVDLVALRQLFKARIMMRLKRGVDGDLQSAEELLEALRNQPSNEAIADDMGRRQTKFLKAIGRNANQRKKVDNLFAQTREMLTKHINPKLVRDLEDAFIRAKKNGGKLPPERDTD
ncbi:MAG: hypothetical protein AAF539_15205 [Planctomycetota bacterium]